MLEFEVGKVAHFEYPVLNRMGIPLEYRWRRVLVTDIRELDLEPLDGEDVARRPLVRRGHQLLIGIDKEIGEERRFYVAAMKGHSPEPLQLIVIDDDGMDSHEPVSRPFQPTVRDQRALLQTLNDLRDTELPENCRLAICTAEAQRD